MFKLNKHGRLILTKELYSVLNDVQYRGNTEVTYRSDNDIYQKSEKWAYPKQDGLVLYGDCEDIALYKRKLLLEYSVPKEPLLLTICLTPDQQGHCVLCVATKNTDRILCNMHDTIMKPSEMISEGFKFLYRQKLGKGIDEPWDVLE